MAGRTRIHRGTKYVVSAAHPAADAFPWLDDNELQLLADDIAAHGQQYKVVRLPDERVVDGRNRELACRIAGVEPQYRTKTLTDDEVITIVISANFHRRSLIPSQRAMVAAELSNLRNGEHKNQVGSAAYLPSEKQENKASQDDAAKSLDVSPRSVRSAKKVKDKAPELAEAVKAGELDVYTAARVADLPEAARKKVAKAKDKKAAAKEALGECDTESEGAAEKLPVIGAINKLCAALDRIKADVVELTADPDGWHIHKESVVSQIEAARKALWQARPTEPCNCVRGGQPANAECKACRGKGITCASRVLKGSK